MPPNALASLLGYNPVPRPTPQIQPQGLLDPRFEAAVAKANNPTDLLGGFSEYLAARANQAAQGLAKTATVDLLGAPVDIANLGASALGVGSANPVGGSQWLEQKAVNAGVFSPSQSGTEDATRILGGFLDPGTMAAAGPKAALAGKEALSLAGGLLGTFAGRGAANANLDLLAKAEKLETKGKSADEIWKDTGWFRGADDKWRFEIDDSAAHFSPDLQRIKPRFIQSTSPEMPGSYVAMNAFGPTKESMVVHPGIAEAYPDHAVAFAAEVHPFVNNDGFRGRAGKMDDGRPFIQLQGTDWDNESLSTVLHEGQHTIQRKEGFARGGTPQKMAVDFSLAKDKYDFDSTVFALVREAESTTGGDISDAARMHRNLGLDVGPAHEDAAMRLTADEARQSFERSANALKKYSRAPISGFSDAGYQLYKKLAGEVESRTVQSRMGLSPEQRRARPPWLDWDVPRDQQIVDFGE